MIVRASEATESSLHEALRALKDSGRKAFVPYLMADYPNAEIFRDAVSRLADAGADALEIGVPFSDPLADGPVIQDAGQHALACGVTPSACVDAARSVRETHGSLPLLFMLYANSIVQSGGDAWLQEVREAGVGGMIVPDRELDDQDSLAPSVREAGLAMIPLVAPTTSEQRAKRVIQGAKGFVYLVSLMGVTGARQGREFRLSHYVRRIRSVTELPLYVGFGISGGEQATQAGKLADGVVVGSALLERLAPLKDKSSRRAQTSALKSLHALAVDIRAALDAL